MSVPVKRPNAPADEETWQAWDGVLRELRAVPGVTSVAGASDPPFRSPSWAPRLLLPGDGPETWREGIAGYAVTPDYFETLGTELMQGRAFEVLDGPGAMRVALVNESFVRTQLSGEDPVGLTVRQGEGDSETPVRIVGVVEDVVQTRADEGPSPAIYFPYVQVDWPSVHVLVRTELPPEEVIPELRQAVARFSPVVPPGDVRSMRDRMASTRTTPRFHAMLIGAFAVVALLLATAGLYGSLSHAVGRRRREIGVRMALGSERSGVLKLVVRQGMGLAAAGLLVGMLATLGLTGVLRGFLFGVRPTDPLTLACVAAILALVSAVACLLPAARATTVDPAEVLRAE
jgi:predicted permease